MFGKRNQEKYLVADGTQALPTGGSAFINATTGVVNVANEQIGVIDAVTRLFLSPGDTFADSPVIKIVQGTANSAAPFAQQTGPLPLRAYEESAPIDGSKIVDWTGISYAAPTNSAYLIGDLDGQTGEIPAIEETRYKLTVGFRGKRTDMTNGRNLASIDADFTTENFTSLGIGTEVRQRDYLVQNLVANINSNSRVFNPEAGSSFVALALRVSGGTTTVETLVTITGGAVGDTILVGYDALGEPVYLTLTQSIIDSVTNAIAAAPTASIVTGTDIIPTLLSVPPSGSTAETDRTANNAFLAGTTDDGNADLIMLIALDQTQATYDREENVKTRLIVGLDYNYGFTSTVQLLEVEDAFPGQGLGRDLNLAYQRSDALHKFDSVQAPDAMVIAYDSHIDTTATYDQYTIASYLSGYDTRDGLAYLPHLTHVLIEPADTTTTAAFEAIMNPWMASIPNQKAAVSL